AIRFRRLTLRSREKGEQAAYGTGVCLAQGLIGTGRENGRATGTAQRTVPNKRRSHSVVRAVGQALKQLSGLDVPWLQGKGPLGCGAGFFDPAGFGQDRSASIRDLRVGRGQAFGACQGLEGR